MFPTFLEIAEPQLGCFKCDLQLIRCEGSLSLEAILNGYFVPVFQSSFEGRFKRVSCKSVDG